MNWLQIRLSLALIGLAAAAAAALWALLHLRRLRPQGPLDRKKILAVRQGAALSFLAVLLLGLGWRFRVLLGDALRARSGQSEAAWRMGERREWGREGLAMDPDAARRWYLQAAEQGLVKAQMRLARIYRDGDGTRRDDREALRWAKRAADQGEPMGMVLVGNILKTSTIVPPDPAEAERLFRAAVPLLEARAAQGDGLACYQLGLMRIQAKGFPADEVEGNAWLLAARRLGLDPLHRMVVGALVEKLDPAKRQAAEARSAQIPPKN